MTAVLRTKNVLLADGVTELPIPVWDIAGDGSLGFLPAHVVTSSAGLEISPNPNGRANASASGPIVLSNEDLAALNALRPVSYETVAASQTDQVMGPTGATGDYLDGVLVVPSSTSPGAVQIKDGSGSAITIFAGGSNSILDLRPQFVPIGAKSGSGAWKLTTGANVSAIGIGNFT